ncbi:MAG: LysR substrate-binding domain-containing protein, partial [Phycisphaerae bacterium]
LYLLPPVLGRFHAKYPDVELHYTIENSLHIEQKILRNELDLGFLGVHPSHHELVAEKLLDDEVVCFSHASHRLAKRRRIDATILAGETWIIREKGSATRQRFESWLAKAGGTLGSIIELQGPEAVKALVAAGVGISFMSIHGLKREIRRRQFKKLPVTGLRLERPIVLVRHADKHTSPVMETFLMLVRAEFADTGVVRWIGC